MKLYSIILYFYFSVSTLFGMHLEIKNQDGKALLKYCIDAQSFTALSQSVEDLGVSETYHQVSSISLQLDEINKKIEQLSGLSVNKSHIKHALDYLCLDHEDPTLSLPVLGLHSVAAGIFFSECWGIKEKKVRKNFTESVQASGYIPTACKYAIENNVVSEVLIELLQSCDYDYREKLPSLLPINYLKRLYKNVYTSQEFCNIEQKIEQLPQGLTVNDIQCSKQYDVLGQWQNSPACRLFNIVHKNSIDRAITNYFNIYQEVKSIDKFVYRSIVHKGNTFTHIPLQYILNKINASTKHPNAHIRYISTKITNVVLTDTDKEYIKKMPKGAEIEFARCVINKKTRKYFGYIGYKRIYYMHPAGYGIQERYDQEYKIMPAYWRWFKLGSGVLFAGCTIALCYYWYQSAKKECADTDLFLAGRADYIRNELIKKVTPDTIDAYKFTYYQKSFDTECSRVIVNTLHAIDPKPINDSVAYTVSPKNYDAAYGMLTGLTRYWNTYNSPFDIWFHAYGWIGISLWCGTLATINQFQRFLYGPKPYLAAIPSVFEKNLSRMLCLNGLGVIFEPLLLIETLLGLNKPKYTIKTDIEKEN